MSTTRLSLNGVMGIPYSFSAKTAFVSVTVGYAIATSISIYNAVAGSPAIRDAVAGSPAIRDAVVGTLNIKPE